MSIKFCTEALEISESQLAALLSVRPETLENYKEYRATLACKVSYLTAAIVVIRSYGIEGKEILNILNKSLDDGDCVLGMIVDGTLSSEMHKALKLAIAEYLGD